MESIDQKLRVGILGATGMVGQRFVSLLYNHPWFEVALLAASPKSAGKTYEEAVQGRWSMNIQIPEKNRNMTVRAIEEDFNDIIGEVDLVFSAIEMDKVKIRAVEDRYAAAGVAVVSNNSAHRWTEDVPMVIPEINANHMELIDIQRKNRGWDKGLIVVKPNCSLQSYLPIIRALRKFGPKEVSVTTLQAISGASKTFDFWPEMIDNCIPFIKGEEEKTEKEPLKILGKLNGGKVENAQEPKISATCIRVPVSNGHMASVSVRFEQNPTLEQIYDAIDNFQNPLSGLGLPSAPEKFIKYFAPLETTGACSVFSSPTGLTADDRPQTKLDRDYESGMGITCGRFREDGDNGWKFVALSHNTVRGAAGGAILNGELLYRKGYLG